MARRTLPRDLTAVRPSDSVLSPYSQTPDTNNQMLLAPQQDSTPDWTVTERVVEESPNRRYAKVTRLMGLWSCTALDSIPQL